MSKLAQLRERRNAKAKAAQELNAKYPADQRMPAAEATQLDAVLAEVEQIDEEISREQRLLALAAEDPAAQTEARLNAATRDPAKQSASSLALKSYLTGGLSALTPEQRSKLEAVAAQGKDIASTKTQAQKDADAAATGDSTHG